jgi:ribose transport system ATP-binding protein
MRADTAPLLQLEGISKSFPGVRALNDVDFEVLPGEVHILLGENGAGKSTLIKIISGAYSADSGIIRISGNPVHIASPTDAIRLGMSTIYQEFNLAPHLSVLENLLLGHERVSNVLGKMDWNRMKDDSLALLRQLDIDDINPNCLVRDLSVAQQRLVEIAKALSVDAKVVIMDEPTACLTRSEIERLFRVIKLLVGRGIGIIYISHRLEEAFEIGSRVTILRDGAKVTTLPMADMTRDDLITLMVGRAVAKESSALDSVVGEELLRADKLSTRDKLQGVSFAVHSGEIVGLAGLLGSGRSEVLKAIFGVDPILSGSVRIDGSHRAIRNPHDAIMAGVGLLTEDRKGSGLALSLPVKENISLASLDVLAPRGVIRLGEETSVAKRMVERLRIRTPGLRQKVVFLSGGNQQKVVFAKWLCRDCRLLLLDEPTKGVDVGAKQEVYGLIREFARSGGGAVLVSSELSELADLCHRVIILRDGSVVRQIDRHEISEHTILEALVS